MLEPLDVVALTPASCGSVVWRHGRQVRLTVIVKATFGLVNGGDARLLPPDPLVVRETYHDNNPVKGVDEPSEVAPYLPGAAVTLSGHAHVAGGQAVPGMAVRLALFREHPLLDKTLHVIGDRSPATQASPKPFQKMRLDWRRALGGVGFPENPIGMGGTPDARSLPNVIDPADPRRPAGFAAISKYLPSRRQFLGTFDRKLLEEPIPEIPESFDWRYYSPAPLDQQVELLHGDEWIVLDGIHPQHARVQTRLPSAVGAARWHPIVGGVAGEGTPLELVADTLSIDADRQCCSVLWRGNLPLDSIEAVAQVCVVAGVELPGSPIPWPRAAEVRPRDRRPGPSRVDEAPADLDSTKTLGIDEAVAAAARPAAPFRPALDQPLDENMTLSINSSAVSRPIAPFAVDPPSARSPGAAVPGAPWSPEPAVRAAPEAFTGEETMTMSSPLAAPPPSRPNLPPPPRPLRPIVAAPPPVPPPSRPGVPPQVIAAPARVGPPPIPPPSSPRFEEEPSAMEKCAIQPGLARAELAPVKDEPTGADGGKRRRAEAKLAQSKDTSFDDDDLSGADLAGLDFEGRSLARCNLTRSNLRGARLQGAKLAGARMEEAELAGAVLTGADLAGAKLARAKGEGAQLDGANLTRADARQASFPRASFAGANLRELQADQADFTGARFTRADLGSASLRSAKLGSAILAHANLEAADLRSADLQRANLHRASRRGAKLAGANQTGVSEEPPPEG